MEIRVRMRRAAGIRTGVLLFAVLLAAAPMPALDAGAHRIVTNVRVSHDRYPAHVEPFLAINPRNPRNLLGVSQLIVPDRLDTVGTFVSFDGGRTWHDNGPLPLPSGRTSGTDVTVAFDAQGIGFVCATAIGGSGSDSRGVYIWRTDNGGRNFHPPVAVVRGDDIDHPWLATDPSKKSSLFVVWGSSQELGFSRSLDGGRTFSPPRIINGGGDSEMPVVAAGPHGAVYVVYESGGGETAVRIDVVSSRDGGRHFGQPFRLGSAPPEIEVHAGLRLPTSPAIAADPRTGAAYVAYATRPQGSAPADILVAGSQDGGRTWSPAVRVTHKRPAADQYVFQPQLAVDSGGTVDVTFFELYRGRINLYLEQDPAGIRAGSPDLIFGPTRRITTRSFNPARGLPHSKHGLWWIGDYQGLAAMGGVIHPLWNDTRTGRLEIFTASLRMATAR